MQRLTIGQCLVLTADFQGCAQVFEASDSASYDPEAFLYDTRGMVISGDGTVVAFPASGSSTEEAVYIYSGTGLLTETKVMISTGTNRYVDHLAISDDGSKIIVISNYHTSGGPRAVVLSGAGWATITVLDMTGLGGTVNHMYATDPDMSGDGSTIVFHVEMTLVRKLLVFTGVSFATRNVVMTTTNPTDFVHDAQLNQDGSVLVTLYEDTVDSVLQVRSGAPGFATIDATITHPSPIYYSAFIYVRISSDGGTIITSVNGNYDNFEGGTVFVFQGGGATWTLVKTIALAPIIPGEDDDWYADFGHGLDLSADGSVLWICAFRRTYDGVNNFAGSVYKYSGANWDTMMEVHITDLPYVAGEGFGNMDEWVSVTSDGSRALVGGYTLAALPGYGVGYLISSGTPVVEAIAEWCGPLPCDEPFAPKFVGLEDPNGNNPDGVILSFGYRHEDSIIDIQSIQFRRDGIWANPTMATPPVWSELGAEATVSGFVNDAAASHVCTLTDAGKVIRMTSGSANTVTIPSDTTVAYPLYTILGARQVGAGTTTIVAAGGVTINRPDSLQLREQHSECGLRKIAINTWDLAGDMAP